MSCSVFVESKQRNLGYGVCLSQGIDAPCDTVWKVVSNSGTMEQISSTVVSILPKEEPDSKNNNINKIKNENKDENPLSPPPPRIVTEGSHWVVTRRFETLFGFHYTHKADMRIVWVTTNHQQPPHGENGDKESIPRYAYIAAADVNWGVTLTFTITVEPLLDEEGNRSRSRMTTTLAMTPTECCMTMLLNV